MMLTDEDLAYMRETQAEARPTPAELTRTTKVPDGMGGETTGPGDPEPIQVRIQSLEASSRDRVAAALVTEYGTSLAVVTMDLVEVSSGDLIKVTPSEVYQVVSDGAVQAWDTAQRVYVTRRGARQA